MTTIDQISNVLNSLVMPIAVSNELIFFLITGLGKIAASGASETTKLAIKTGISDDISRGVILTVGIIEIITVLLVYFGAFRENYKLASIGTYILIFLTFMTAIIMHTFPMEYIEFFTYMAIISGLVYIELVFFKKLF